MVRVSDYIASRLREAGIIDVFMLTGGGAMHLNDALGNAPGLNVTFCHHEQACAIAAEGYARASGRLAAVNVTTGPGGLNALTGVMGQWTDSVPAVYLSGQVRYDTTVYANSGKGIRQVGDQELPIVDIVRPMVKYAVVLKDAKDSRKVMDTALRLATEGRPGPVWIDVPMNVQSARIDPDSLEGETRDDGEARLDDPAEAARRIYSMLNAAERPAVIAGHGVRLSGQIDNLKKWTNGACLPVLTTFNGFDAVEDDDPCFIGRIGTIGNRAGNFVLQNADLVVCLGTRNNIRQISYNWENFARSAKKVVIDIDAAELEKPTIRPDVGFAADLRGLIPELLKLMDGTVPEKRMKWMEWARERRAKNPTWPADKAVARDIDPYAFCRALSDALPEGAILVSGNATPSIAYLQSGKCKPRQHVIWNSGCAAMGYDLPAAIGACVGSGKKDVICITGDGSIQMNIQELATIAYRRLPIKIICFNNGGYISIKQTQDSFFPGRRVGIGPESGVGFPDMQRIAAAYGIPRMSIRNGRAVEAGIRKVLRSDGPIFCEVMLPHDYVYSPKLSSEKKPDGRMVSKPLEDMYPFMDREEFLSNMIVPPIEER